MSKRPVTDEMKRRLDHILFRVIRGVIETGHFDTTRMTDLAMADCQHAELRVSRTTVEHRLVRLLWELSNAK